MFKTIAVTGLMAGGLLAGAFTATSALAARMGGMPGGGMPGMHAAPHIAPGGPAMHAPRGAFNNPGPGGAHGRVHGWQGGRHHGSHYGHGHFHHRRGFGVIIGSGFYDGDYYGGYGGCAWLHERAIETGSRYWWRRYEDCIEG